MDHPQYSGLSPVAGLAPSSTSAAEAERLLSDFLVDGIGFQPLGSSTSGSMSAASSSMSSAASGQQSVDNDNQQEQHEQHEQPTEPQWQPYPPPQNTHPSHMAPSAASDLQAGGSFTGPYAPPPFPPPNAYPHFNTTGTLPAGPLGNQFQHQHHYGGNNQYSAGGTSSYSPIQGDFYVPIGHPDYGHPDYGYNAPRMVRNHPQTASHGERLARRRHQRSAAPYNINNLVNNNNLRNDGVVSNELMLAGRALIDIKASTGSFFTHLERALAGAQRTALKYEEGQEEL